MKGKILVGLLALTPKPVVVANGYLIGQHTVALLAIQRGKLFLSRETRLFNAHATARQYRYN